MRLLFLILLLFSMCNCFGQLTNDGGILYIQDGATVYADTNIINKNTAITTNEGTLKTTNHLQNNSSSTFNGNGQYHIEQDWINTAIFTKDSSKVIFNNSSNSNLTSGGDDFYDLEMNKDAGNNLTLLDNTTISNNLNFAADSNNIFIESFNLTMGNTTTLTGFDENKYIITGGTGQLIKNNLSNFTFPVGFDENTYNPVVLTENGTVDNIGVRCFENVLEAGTSGNVLTEDFINTSWEITEAVANGSNFDLECQWVETDELLNFNRDYSDIAFYTGIDWEASSFTTATGSDPYIQSSTELTQFGVFSVRSDDAICETPDGPFATDILADRAVISSGYVGLADRYYYRYRENGVTGPSTFTLKIRKNGNPFTLRNLVPGTEYEMNVRVRCDDGSFSDWSDDLIFETSPCFYPDPISVTLLLDDRFRLEWIAVPLAEKYQIWYRPLGSSDPHDKIVTVNPFRTILDLIPGTTYQYRVRTLCEYGWSYLSPQAFVTTTGSTSIGDGISNELSKTGQSREDILLYPNPTSNLLFVEIPSEINPEFVEILDINGRQILNVTSEQLEKGINISELLQGTYLFVLFDLNGNKNVKRFGKF